MGEQRDEFRVEPVSSRGVSPAVPILTFLVGIFIGAAFVKPWDLVFPAEGPAIAPPPAVAASSPRPSPSPAPAGQPAECAFAGGWRVFALGQPDPLGGDGSTGSGAGASEEPAPFADIGNPLRRWLEVDPLRVSSGPADQRIPFVTIVSDRIGGIGYCPPPDGTDGPPAGVRLDAWVIGSSGTPTAMPLRAVTLDPASSIEIAVFIGADRPAGRDERWASGRYIFAVEAPDAGGYGRWFGVEIRTPPGRLPS